MEQIPQCFGGSAGDIYISRLADLAAGGILPSGQRSVVQGAALCGIVVDLPGGIAVLFCISAAGFRQCYSCDEGDFLGIGGISAALSWVIGTGFKDSAAVVGAADSGGTADAWGDSSVLFRVCKIKKSATGCFFGRDPTAECWSPQGDTTCRKRCHANFCMTGEREAAQNKSPADCFTAWELY